MVTIEPRPIVRLDQLQPLLEELAQRHAAVIQVIKDPEAHLFAPRGSERRSRGFSWRSLPAIALPHAPLRSPAFTNRSRDRNLVAGVRCDAKDNFILRYTHFSDMVIESFVCEQNAGIANLVSAKKGSCLFFFLQKQEVRSAPSNLNGTAIADVAALIVSLWPAPPGDQTCHITPQSPRCDLFSRRWLSSRNWHGCRATSQPPPT